MDKQVTEHSLEDVALATATQWHDIALRYMNERVFELGDEWQDVKDERDYALATATELYEADSEARAEATELWFMYDSCEDDLDKYS